MLAGRTAVSAISSSWPAVAGVSQETCHRISLSNIMIAWRRIVCLHCSFAMQYFVAFRCRKAVAGRHSKREEVSLPKWVIKTSEDVAARLAKPHCQNTLASSVARNLSCSHAALTFSRGHASQPQAPSRTCVPPCKTQLPGSSLLGFRQAYQ